MCYGQYFFTVVWVLSLGVNVALRSACVPGDACALRCPCVQKPTWNSIALGIRVTDVVCLRFCSRADLKHRHMPTVIRAHMQIIRTIYLVHTFVGAVQLCIAECRMVCAVLYIYTYIDICMYVYVCKHIIIIIE